jgi:hypothetical protein
MAAMVTPVISGTTSSSQRVTSGMSIRPSLLVSSLRNQTAASARNSSRVSRPSWSASAWANQAATG